MQNPYELMNGLFLVDSEPWQSAAAFVFVYYLTVMSKQMPVGCITGRFVGKETIKKRRGK